MTTSNKRKREIETDFSMKQRPFQPTFHTEYNSSYLDSVERMSAGENFMHNYSPFTSAGKQQHTNASMGSGKWSATGMTPIYSAQGNPNAISSATSSQHTTCFALSSPDILSLAHDSTGTVGGTSDTLLKTPSFMSPNTLMPLQLSSQHYNVERRHSISSGTFSTSTATPSATTGPTSSMVNFMSGAVEPTYKNFASQQQHLFSPHGFDFGTTTQQKSPDQHHKNKPSLTLSTTNDSSSFSSHNDMTSLNSSMAHSSMGGASMHSSNVQSRNTAHDLSQEHSSASTSSGGDTLSHWAAQFTAQPQAQMSNQFGAYQDAATTQFPQPQPQMLPPNMMTAKLASEIVHLNQLYHLFVQNPFINNFASNTPVCMLKRDEEDAEILSCNDAFAALVGRNHSECARIRASTLGYQDFMQPFANHFANSLASRLRYLFLTKIQHGERRVKLGNKWFKETFVLDRGVMYCKYDEENEWSDSVSFNSSHSFERTMSIGDSDNEIAQAQCAKRMFTLVSQC